MEQLIRAANFTRYYSRDVDKLSQLPRNCRVRATYHPSNLARREIAASCAARVPPHASFPRAFPSVCVCIYRGVASPPSSLSLAKPWQVQRHAECRASRLAIFQRSGYDQPLDQPPLLLLRLTLTKRRLSSIKSTHRRYSYRMKGTSSIFDALGDDAVRVRT